MARQKNDGRGRLGGRAKGTPNKTTSTLKGWITQVIEDNKDQMLQDLATLEPKERLQMLERLMGYVIPKQQTMRATIDYNMLSDEELGYIIDELTKEV